MDIKKEILKWKKDNSVLKEVKDLEFPEGMVLIDVFFYKPPAEEKEFKFEDIDGNVISDKKKEYLLPFCKILSTPRSESVFFNSFKPGDIGLISDSMMSIQKNPQFEMWKEALKERPKPEMTMPQEYIGAINNWANYVFRIDKLDETPEFKLIFLIPQTFIISKVKDSYFDKYKVTELEVVKT